MTPYAMHYDGALLAPAAVVLLVEGLEAPDWTLRLLAFCVVCEVTTPYMGLPCLAAFTLFTVVRGQGLPGGARYLIVKCMRPDGLGRPAGTIRFVSQPLCGW